MRTFFILLITVLSIQVGAKEEAKEKKPKEKTPTKKIQAMSSQSNTKSMMMIDPKDRALDYIKAYEKLRMEVAPAKVYFHIEGEKALNNVLQITLMENNTLLLFRVSTPQGAQYKVVPIEDILEITHEF